MKIAMGKALSAGAVVARYEGELEESSLPSFHVPWSHSTAQFTSAVMA